MLGPDASHAEPIQKSSPKDEGIVTLPLSQNTYDPKSEPFTLSASHRLQSKPCKAIVLQQGSLGLLFFFDMVSVGLCLFLSRSLSPSTLPPCATYSCMHALAQAVLAPMLSFTRPSTYLVLHYSTFSLLGSYNLVLI